MWHPLLALIVAIAAIAFRMTTRRRICPTCGFDGREETRRGFDCGDAAEVARERAD
jgi:hypothetical protein